MAASTGHLGGLGELLHPGLLAGRRVCWVFNPPNQYIGRHLSAARAGYLSNRLAAHRQAVQEFVTTRQGYRLATSTGGVLTEHGFAAAIARERARRLLLYPHLRSIRAVLWVATRDQRQDRGTEANNR